MTIGPTSGHVEDCVLKTIDPATGAVEIDFGFSHFVHCHLKMTGDVTISFINALNGSVLFLMFEQDATGSRIVTWPAGCRIKSVLTTGVSGAFDTMHLGVMMGNLHEHSFVSDIPLTA